MNRLIALFLCALLSTAAVDAQFRKNINDAPRHRIMTGIGAWPLTPGGEIFQRFGEDIFYHRYTESILDHYYGSDMVYFGKTITTGSIFAEYGYRLSRWIDVGMSITYTGFFSNVYDSYSYEKIGNDNYFYISATPIVRLMWGRTDSVNWYSGAGIGMTFTSNSDYSKRVSCLRDSAFPSFYFVPIGLMFGRGKVFGFSEIGMGVNGLFSAGIGMRL